MSLQRHLDNPFWATSLDRMDASVAEIVRGLDRLVRRSPALQDLIWPGSGWRPGSAEHSSGCAIDEILVAVGHRPTPDERFAMMRFIDEALIPNWKELGIRWILFSTDGRNRTQSWNPARGYWKNLDPRGGISANHIDHCHILFHASATWPAHLEQLVVGGPTAPAPSKPTPGLPTTGAEGPVNPTPWDGKTFPGAAAFKSGQKHPAVKVVQERLKAHGYDPGVVDSYWGPVSNTATRRFQLAQGWTGSDADGIPGPETWRRLLAAPKPEAKPRVSLQAIRRAATLDPKRPQGGTTPGAADDVRLVEDALRKEGLLSSRYASDGSFGTLTVKAYARWQQRLGYRGRDADGIPGRASLEKLGAKQGFDVTT